MHKIKTSVILPTYNEAGNIIKLVETIRQEVSINKTPTEIIIIDDNSPDKTGLLAQKYFSKIPEVRVLIRHKERGLATAIRKGIEISVGDVIVVMDTDFNHEPRLIKKLVEKCKKYDIAIGSRYVIGGGMVNKKREILSKLYNILLIKPILGSSVNDNLCGFFAINRDKLEQLDFDLIFYGYGEYFMRLIYFAQKQGKTFTELPCFYKERTYGDSKSKFINMSIDYVRTALRLRLNYSKEGPLVTNKPE